MRKNNKKCFVYKNLKYMWKKVENITGRKGEMYISQIFPPNQYTAISCIKGGVL